MTTSHREKTREPQQITERELQQDLLDLVARAEQAKTLTAMVTLVMVGLRVLGLKLIRLTLKRRDEDLHRQRQGPPCCPRCGQKLRRPKRKWTTRVTLLGKLRYRRRSWLCARCHKTHQPLDATLDLVVMHHGHSLEFVRELTLLCTLHSFEQGCTLFERCFGFEVSTHLAHRMVMGIGGKLHMREMARAKELWKRREKHPEEFEPTPAALRKRERADRVYVMLDNSRVRIQEGKRGRGAPKRTKQKGVLERFNLHNAGPVLVKENKQKKASKGEGRRGLEGCAGPADPPRSRRGQLQQGSSQDPAPSGLDPCGHARPVVSAAAFGLYGGAGIWDTIDELLPSTRTRKVTQILDWCHAVSYLWKMANVIQRLKRLQRGKSGTLFDEIRRCLDYLEEHRGRMHYPQYRKAGMTIGSGAIESVHKWVIQARCKQAGMAWSEQGINAMLRLRCVWASGRWDEIFALPKGADGKLFCDSVIELAA